MYLKRYSFQKTGLWFLSFLHCKYRYEKVLDEQVQHLLRMEIRIRVQRAKLLLIFSNQ